MFTEVTRYLLTLLLNEILSKQASSHVHYEKVLLDYHILFITTKLGYSLIKFVRGKHRKCCIKKNVLIKTSQNSQENSCARVSFLKKLQA